MSNTNILMDKIDNVFKLKDNEQRLKTEDISELTHLIQCSNLVSLTDTSKHKLLTLIKKNLQTTNTELQKNTLALLCQSFDLNLFAKDLLVSETLLVIIDGAFKRKVENLEDQELWLKALDALLKFADTELTPLIIKHSLDILEAIKLALTSKVINSPKKLKALKLLNEIITKIDLDESNTKLLLSILFTILIPSMFNEESRHFKNTLDVASKIISKIPFKQRKADTNWSTYTRTQFISTYVPFMTKMISDEKLLYSQLWKFSLKNLHTDIHTNSNLINNLLSILEKAFKAKNMGLRKEAFLCWQDFIRSFLLLKDRIPAQRINLLTVPLKTNNCKTNELICVKYQTWCILLNTIHILKIFSNEFSVMLENFLHFSFGPMGETPLLSYTLNQEAISPGKKIPKLHMIMCENLFKIIASPSLFDKYTPVSKLEIVSDTTMLNSQMFVKLSRTIVYSVGEASILLSNCTDNENEAKLLNELLWQALFDLCQTVVKPNENVHIIQELVDLTVKIIAVSRQRSNLTTFCNETIVRLIVVENYSFCKLLHKEKTIFHHIFVALFDDVEFFYTQSNAATLLELIMRHKRKQSEYLAFIDKCLDQINVIVKQTGRDKGPIDSLFDSWRTVGNEISTLISESGDNIPITLTSTFTTMMIWCIENIHLAAEPAAIFNVWKSYLERYRSKLGDNDYNINSICSIFINSVMARNDFDETSSKFFYIIISSLCYKKGSDLDYKKELVYVLKKLNEFVSQVNLSENIIANLKDCIDFIFKNVSSKIIINKILPQLYDTVTAIKINYPQVCLVDSLTVFIKYYKPTDKTKPTIQKLIKTVLQNVKKEERHFEFYQEYIKKSNEPIINLEMSKVNENVEPDCSLSAKKMIIDGVDIDTMTPVKVKGSLLNNADVQKNEHDMQTSSENATCRMKKPPNLPMSDDFIYVNTPYHFNPKKLTKLQKEKLKRKRDDIPAMYNDLSQSQTLDFSNSCSSLNATNTVNTDTSTNSASQTVRAFGAVCSDNDYAKAELEVSPKKKRVSGIKQELNRIKMDNIMGFEDYLKRNSSSPRHYTRMRVATTKMESGDSSSTPKRGTGTKMESGDSSSTPKPQSETNDSNPTLILKAKRGRPKTKQPKDSERNDNLVTLDVVECSQTSQVAKEIVPDETDADKQPKEVKQAKLENVAEIKVNNDSKDTNGTPKIPTNLKIKFKVTDFADEESKKYLINELKKNDKYCRVKLEKSRVIQRRSSLESADLNPQDASDALAGDGPAGKKMRRNSLKEEILTEETKKIIPKIKLLRSQVEDKVFVIDRDLQPIETDETNENDKETESVCSDMFNDDVLTEQYPNANHSICRKVLFDKNDDSDDTNLDSSREKSKSPEPVVEIVTSPIRHDTPTRNKELVQDTSEISPIKHPAQRNICNDLANLTKPDSEKSPELFSENANKEIVISECSTPVLPKKNSRKSKFTLQGRGARMMNLITPNGCQKVEEIPAEECEPSNSESAKTESKITLPTFSSASSRITKMMVQFDSKSNDKAETPVKKAPTNEEDFLHFTKDLPLPDASPRFGILRKRKHPDEPEEGLSPCAKKKRVNFNDPPLSALKFIEKYQNIRSRSSASSFTTNELTEMTENPMIMNPSDTGSVADENEQLPYNKDKVIQIDSSDMHTLNNLELPCSAIKNANYIEINGITKNTKYFDMYQRDKLKKTSATNDELTCTTADSNEVNINSDSTNDSTEKQSKIDSYVIETDSPMSPDETIDIAEISPSDNETTSENVTIQSEKTTATIGENDLKSYQKLTSCNELLSSCLTQNSQNEKLILALKDENIKTMGEFSSFVIENPPLLAEFKQIKQILDLHSCGDHSPKHIRKIKPITISSPSGRRTSQVSVISTSEQTNSADSCILSNMSEYEPTAHNRNINEMSESQDKLSCNWISPISKNEQNFDISLAGAHKHIVSQISNMCTETSNSASSTNSLDWNQLFCNVIGADKVAKLLLLQRSSRDSNIVSMIKVIASYNAPKLFETMLELIASSENMCRVFQCYFIPNILKNPNLTCCIANNLSLLELQEHLVDRLTKDHENKEAFLRRLNENLGHTSVVVRSSNEQSVSDSLSSQTKQTLFKSLLEQLQVLKQFQILNIDDEDWETIFEVQKFIQNLVETKVKTITNKNSS